MKEYIVHCTACKTKYRTFERPDKCEYCGNEDITYKIIQTRS